MFMLTNLNGASLDAIKELESDIGTPLIDRLAGSLQVDIGKNRELLQWRPMQTPLQAVRRTVRSIAEEARSG